VTKDVRPVEKEYDDFRNLIACSPPSHRRLRERPAVHPRKSFLEAARVARCHEPGTNDIGPDPGVCEFDGKRLCQAHQSGLGGGVAAQLCETALANDGGDIDDSSRALLQHLRGDAAHPSETGREIRVDDFIPLCIIEFGETDALAYASIVHESIDAPPAFEAQSQCGCHALCVADIRADGDEFSSPVRVT
jgi:hypothetical protein